MSEQNDLQVQLMLGQIKGIAEGLRDSLAEHSKRFDKIDDRMDGVDERLRSVEQKAAVAGALSGGAVGVGMALIIEGLKGWMRHKGGEAPLMAHATERRTQLRGLYVFKRLTMEGACGALHVPKSTANRWKLEAKAKGDDWDSARAAIALGDEGFTQLSRKLLEDYLVQHQAAMDMMREDKAMPALQRVQMLASLGDSFNKTMASFRRLAPELNRHAVALDALQRFATFTQQRFPKNVPALLEMLEPFGEELAKAYG